jgi:hypothetical protein
MQKVNHETSLPNARRLAGAAMRSAGLFLVAAAASSALLEEVARPASRAGTAREPYSWELPHARVLPTGNLEWAPRQFVFEKGRSVRYIDFEGGDDSVDGMTKNSAWKHHPWDGAATGKAKTCSGVHTYVFKGGVVYRGTLKARESGTADDPVRLTRDPSWGDGNAVFSGSSTIKGGWRKADAEAVLAMPEPERIWYIDLGANYDRDRGLESYSAIWQIEGDKVERLHIARTPNYDLSDPNNPVKNWPRWERIDNKTSTYHAPIIKELKGTSTDALKDVVIWATAPTLMGSASPKGMAKAKWDLETGSITTGAFGDAATYARQRPWNFFMIENAAVLLDSPGEYFFARKGPHAGRLYLRPAGDVDPNTVRYEVAQNRQFISIVDKSNIVISGLEFRYNDPFDGQRRDSTRHNTRAAHCILIVGNCSNITVANNAFYDVADAVEARLYPTGRGPKDQVMDNIVFSDNDVRNASGAGVICVYGQHYHPIFPKNATYGRLLHVEVMRNRLVNTGFRGANARWDSLPAISVLYPETCEIAGNIIDTSMGIGIITFGGKASGHGPRTAPLTRFLIHHNQIDNTMLGANDYGGLEHFQGGPTYIYNNVSRNTVGNRSFWNHMLGYNLYLDGGFKCYAFNNILSGLRPDQPDHYGHCGYFMVFGFLNQFFNNTLCRFENGMDGSSGNRSNILGNLISECENAFIRQNRPGDHSMLGGGDTGEMGRMGIPTMAYDSNVFYGSPKEFGQVAGTRKAGERKAPVVTGKTLKELSNELKAQKCRLSGLGWQIGKHPITDPAGKDYRPSANAGIEGRGVKYFVPWALARTVGEWNFYKHASSPDVVLGESFYMTDEYMNRGQYYFLPRNDLTVSGGVTADDYGDGPLEDWTEGALTFNGKRLATLSHADMTRNVEYPASRRSPAVKYDGSKRETVDMASNNFTIEIFFKTEAGHTGGTLVSKADRSAGCELSISPEGTARLTIRARLKPLLQPNGVEASAASTAKVNDGQWHHLFVEVDRAAARITFYVDGDAAGQSAIDTIGKDAALSNPSDFVVGRGLVGTVDFLRVCRSTLAESKTTMAELYAWQFDGPFLKDFTGRSPGAGRSRDCGAIQSGP